MSHLNCPTCKEFMLYPDSHRCAPQWEVWQPDNDETRDDGARTVRGHDVEEVVRRWASQRDSDGDYSIVGGSPAVVCVARTGSDDVRYLRVEGYTVPEYRAEVIDEDEVKLLTDWNAKYPKGTKVRVTMDDRPPPSYNKVGEKVVEATTVGSAYFNDHGDAEVRVNARPFEAHLDKVEPIEEAG